MTDTEYAYKLDEIDRLLNDPNVPIQPGRIWALLDDVARQDDDGQDDLASRRSVIH
jgi:hypothetical protein